MSNNKRKSQPFSESSKKLKDLESLPSLTERDERSEETKMNNETNEINEIYLSDVKKCPRGRCIDCWEFIPNNEDMKACSCKEKKGYMTQNALRSLACKEYRELIGPEYHDHLIGLGYKTKDILKAMKTARKEYHDNENSPTRRSAQITLQLRTRDILALSKD